MLASTLILSGDDLTPWSDEQKQCVLEIRAEQRSDDPTSFSLLMNYMPENEAKLPICKDQKLAVLVRENDALKTDWKVLFYGVVLDVDSEETQGGIGSQIRFTGVDIRILLAGHGFRGAWSGTISGVMEYLIGQEFPQMMVDAPENNDLDEEENPLGQNSNHLDFLRAQALENGFHIWVEYDVDSLLGLGITPKICWAQSPILSSKPLRPQIDFRVHTDAKDCPNVTLYEFNESENRQENLPADDSASPNATSNNLVPKLSENSNLKFKIPQRAEQAGEGERIADVLRMEGSFSIKIAISSTKSRLKRLAFAHDIGFVIGAQKELIERPLRVYQVTHVINESDHFMDIKLEGRPGAEGLENPYGKMEIAL